MLMSKCKLCLIPSALTSEVYSLLSLALCDPFCFPLPYAGKRNKGQKSLQQKRISVAWTRLARQKAQKYDHFSDSQHKGDRGFNS